MAVLKTVDTLDGAPFRTVDQVCNGHRLVDELLYDCLIFVPRAQLERHRASRVGSAAAPDSVLAWSGPVLTNQTGEYEETAATVTAFWTCPTGCGRDNRQTFQRLNSTTLHWMGGVGGGCMVNGQVVNNTSREVPYRYAVTYLSSEAVRPNQRMRLPARAGLRHHSPSVTEWVGLVSSRWRAAADARVR